MKRFNSRHPKNRYKDHCKLLYKGHVFEAAKAGYITERIFIGEDLAHLCTVEVEVFAAMPQVHWNLDGLVVFLDRLVSRDRVGTKYDVASLRSEEDSSW